MSGRLNLGSGGPWEPVVGYYRAVVRLEHVVRTRMFVTDVGPWEAIGHAHGEFFREIRPVATMVDVSALIDPDMVVEIEAEAYGAEEAP